jgi:hypothetical protein
MLDISKGWRFVLELVLFILGCVMSSSVPIGTAMLNASVVKQFIGQIRTGMAFPATRATFKNPKSLSRCLRESFIL